jgi:FeS assembly SUF system protein
MDTKPSRVPLETTDSSLPLAAPSTVPVPNQPEAGSPAGEALQPEQVEEILEKIVAALRTCFDPEIPVNIYELGLIYGIDVSLAGAVSIQMTLTSPACPAAGSLPPEVQRKVQTIPGVTAAKVEIVWDPPWTPDRMSEAAKLQLGIF